MLSEKIDEDLKSAMKNKKEALTATLRMLKAAIQNKEIEKKTKPLQDSDLLELIQKQIKQRKDSIADFEKANRQDLLKKETAEVGILEQYLPKQLSDEELKSIVQKAVLSAGAKSKADMGKVMKEVLPQVVGKADGKRVSQIVGSLLP
ncbi:MAG: GatB/YqeY domain-containing protein [Candidatus Omnitrophica bacterium]|nr:GatB/YqeY domain-containing protein [Candidatus Omnitrophota bacterium]